MLDVVKRAKKCKKIFNNFNWLTTFAVDRKEVGLMNRTCFVVNTDNMVVGVREASIENKTYAPLIVNGK